MKQAACQWSLTSGTSSNCIVWCVKREQDDLDKAQLRGLRVAEFHQVVVLGHTSAIMIWPSDVATHASHDLLG